MKRFLLMVVLCGALSCALPIVQEMEHISEKDMEFATKYMEKYYPESESITPDLRRRRSTDPSDKLQQMQEFFGLKVTGNLDPSTLDVMRKPRCGVPETEKFSTFAMSPKWGKKDLTYSIQNYTPDMHQADVDDAIERAWKVWSDVTPLTFSRVYGGPADIEISFAARSHGDYIPFDGPGGELAHAYSPAFGGNAHFDEDENWSTDLQGTNLFLVAAHEFGHSLGLGHSSVWGSLMFPMYHPSDPKYFRLHRDDIEGIQYLYGPPENDRVSSGTPTPPPKIPTVAPSTDSCDSRLAFDAVTTLRGESLFFKDSFFWRKNSPSAEAVKTPISEFWPALSSGVDAAYEVEDDDTVFLFKGRKYWATKGNIIQPGFPKNILHLGFPGNVKKVDGAAYDGYSKKTYFFSGNKYWRYDEAKNSMEEGYPRKITADFHGIGPKVDAAFLDYGRFYLFNGSNQYEFDYRTKRFLAIKKSNSWFNCQ
ncbi:stromelysin-1-like [Elgaria multicarinata webbii]|uniref:stromelysin-1-like n=1 Tax=Elgaria multicarinata webbii TaxID=159646 RepID=UPI002FCD3652